jgi:hypothetical protein
MRKPVQVQDYEKDEEKEEDSLHVVHYSRNTKPAYQHDLPT